MRTPVASRRVVLSLCVSCVWFGFFGPSGVQAEIFQAALPIEATNLVMTSNPSFKNGINVNTFLGANRFYNAGITGQNTITASVEAGRIWNGHETLAHATSSVVGTGALGDYDRHATWVGMLIGGRNGGSSQGDWQTGIAYGTDLRSGSMATAWNGAAYTTSFSLTFNSFYSVYNAFYGTADVINSSWGGTDNNGTSFQSMTLDGMARANPRTTLVAAAGNSGPSNNTVNGPASGYNSISVGALTGSNTYNALANFSSRGPQDYYDSVHGNISGVRAAVDLVAPGDSLTSAYYGGTTGGNTGGTANGGSNYYSNGIAGTSFAAPLVAGGVALLDSASKANNLTANSRDTRVIKAVLMNSADKITGWTNNQSTINNVITTTQSLDWGLGAGRMNLDEAYDQYLSGTEDVSGFGGGSVLNVGWDYAKLNSVGSHNDYVFSTNLLGGSMLDVTLDWFRNRSTDGVDFWDESYANFDLEVWDSSFTTLVATSKSAYNNTELLHFALPATGSYALRVVYTNQVFGSVAQEYYGLAWAATAVPEPSTCLMLVSVAIAFVYWRRRR